SRGLATDTSGDAVALAKETAARLGLEIEPLAGDLFDPVPAPLRGSVDLVVANPPYLSAGSAAPLPPEVLADPPGALFGDAELAGGIFSGAAAWLRPGRTVAVEIDEGSAGAVAASARDAGLTEVRVRRDLADRDRVVSAARP